MADDVQIKVDATSARLKLERIAPAVRNQLRQVLPQLTLKIGAAVNAKLDSELKSRTRLNVTQELRESANQIYGAVRIDWVGEQIAKLVPTYLEYGTQRHWVAPITAKALHWVTDAGDDAFSKGHYVSGIKAHNFMSRTFREMQSEIVETIRTAAKTGASKT